MLAVLPSEVKLTIKGTIVSLGAITSNDTITCETETVCDILSELHDVGNLGTPIPRKTEYLLCRAKIISDLLLYQAVV